MLTTAVLVQGLAFLAVGVAVAALGLSLADRKTGRRLTGRVRGRGEPVAGRGGWRAVTQRLGRLVASGEKARAADLRRQLVYAGYFQQAAVNQFLGARLVSVVGAAVGVGVAVAVVGGQSWNRTALGAVAGGAVGFLAPSLVLSSQVKKRQRLLHKALPDALDIMVMCVESGVSLNAALDWVTDEIQAVHPVLGTELVIVRREVQLGLTAGDAFRNFAERSGVVDVRDLAAVLLQSERHGASVAKALRAYADTARHDRQMWVEEMSQKAAVKIVFPTLLCIFPAMFTVLLGPAAFQMAKLFAK